MAQMMWVELRGLLANRYDELRFRLRRRLGSEELASETLHEIWLRLHRQDAIEEGSEDGGGPVQSPISYLMRMAINVATDVRRAEQRKLRSAEVSAILELADPAPGPDQVFEARRRFEALRLAVDQLPERTRAILSAARLDGETHRVIAERFGISTRMVQLELKRAVEFCRAQLDHPEKNVDLGFAPAPPPSSIQKPSPASAQPTGSRADGRRERPDDDGR
jgi:RNA polymerase sigma factor (sigma-70 family)